MQKEIFFTAGQFSKLHHLNKRTLHYYDDIGLFSPIYKAENGYRYYARRQSAELENILALRELGMSIEEIKDYLRCPGTEAFLKLSIEKSKEIDEQIKRLKKLKAIMHKKQKALVFCSGVSDGRIETVYCPTRYILLTPMQFRGSALTGMEHVMAHLQTAWECSSYKTGCGSYISLDKIRKGQFEPYDGLFTFVDKLQKGVSFQSMPAGKYLCGYCIGSWDKIPELYQNMLNFAASEELELTGNCYEIGLNEFAISCEDEYVTRVEIQCRDK